VPDKPLHAIAEREPPRGRVRGWSSHMKLWGSV
jgi:hypothetical protein